MKTLVGNGENIHSFHGFRNDTKYTPLRLAVKNGHLETVQFLHENGSDIILPGPNGYTPLHYASLYGHLDIVKYLTENGARGNMGLFANTEGYGTPLFMAAKAGYLDIVKVRTIYLDN